MKRNTIIAQKWGNINRNNIPSIYEQAGWLYLVLKKYKLNDIGLKETGSYTFDIYINILWANNVTNAAAMQDVYLGDIISINVSLLPREGIFCFHSTGSEILIAGVTKNVFAPCRGATL